MKKIHALCLCAILCSCGGNGKQQTSVITEKIVEETTISQALPEKEATWYDG